ncbi:DUF4304 domain-containing protein [Inhella proteolytica]|uniref:DUF4304 domain-containing protein n=1 Tax=Inhella proteolytica TaxID=2795029 RepID=A0A931J6Q4_9BURK|nr:DUF4304 domain-containing protein [Inhella proteolytica]MBH9579250.1 DUF4304 domain-containing protein [Inhella proteolytica]
MLAPLGFKRKSRTLWREQGEGVQRHWQIVNLQAGEWNEGSRGEFYVNLALQFPAIDQMRAQCPGEERRLEGIEKPDDARGHIRCHLEDALPADHWLVQTEGKLGKDTDLLALAEAHELAATGHVLPWFDQHASVEAVRDFADSGIEPSIPTRLAAALVLRDREVAQRLVDSVLEPWKRWSPAYLRALSTWLQVHGVDAGAWTRASARKSTTAAHQSSAAQRPPKPKPVVKAFESPAESSHHSPAQLADAWFAEFRKLRHRDPDPLRDLPTGPQIGRMDARAREETLFALLQKPANWERGLAPSALYDSQRRCDADEALPPLLAALLPGLPQLEQTTPLFDILLCLQTRLKQELVTARFPWGFSVLAAWLEGQSHSAALTEGIRTWLARLSVTVVKRWEVGVAFLAAERSKPLDPNDSMYEFMKESRERMAELEAQEPVDPEAIRRRLTEYPEQVLAPADKAAVRSWRRWLRRDPVTGLLPVHFEPDDFGGPAQAAWDSAPPVLKTAAAPVIQHWLEGVPTKPSQRWLRELRAHIAGFDAAQLQPWRDWVRARLAAFPHSSGRTEWATTGARPGVGARLGECSEDLLMGLLWWSALDPELHDAPWQAVATAAFERLPDVGVRAPAVGGLALRLLAGQGGAAASWVAAQAKAKGAKQLAKAAEKALAEPWLNPA